jgi:DNA-binding winged helix-turn-helix (wHTH) protein
MADASRYVFGDFVLDCGTHELRRAGREVPLGGKGFELLELLIRFRPRVLSRTRLVAALWPASHVGQTSLHVLVSQVRAALGDDAQEPHWVRTVHRVGYAFRGEASEEDLEATRLADPTRRPRLNQDAREWVLCEGENVLGRDEGVAVRVEAKGVSRRHAKIVVSGDHSTIEDLGSKNGTFVGQEAVTSPRRLLGGEVVRLGKRTRLVFEDNSGGVTESESSKQ